MNNRSILFSLAVLLLLATNAFAQGGDPMDVMSFRATSLIDSTMKTLNIRADRFNEELAKVNKAKPLDVASLDSASIVKNKAIIKDFLNYLEVYRSLSDKMRTQVEDSVHAMRAEMPQNYKHTWLKEFIDSYHKDQSAFDKYTLTLTKVYSSVLDVLNFLTEVKVTVVGDKLQFASKPDYDKYQDYMNVVMEAQRKQIAASAASQKATFEASQEMQEAYGKAGKQ